MGIEIRCPHCLRYFGAPDLESVKVYAAQGGMIQTLTERIVAQPIHKHYITPEPVMRSVALILPLVFFAPGLTLYFNINPLISGTVLVSCASALFVWSSSRVEMIEQDESPEDDPEEPEPQPAAPQPFIEVRKPGPNSLAIRVAHEPPASDDPKRQRTLGQADIALARLVTGPSPVEPISWANVRKAGYRPGEKTFYLIQHRWVKEGLAFRSENGAVYLKAAGRSILAQYAKQVAN